MDELLSLMVTAPVATQKSLQSTEGPNRKLEVVTPPTDLKRSNTQFHHSSSSSGTLTISEKCPYSSYNISRRESSSQEVANILESSNCSFIPLARLSTMSHQSLENQRATSPIATIGIVKSASGTKLSKNGNAYAILEIASIYCSGGRHNMECISMMSLFLFGQAYSSFNVKIRVADVVLILDPLPLPASHCGEGSKNKTLQSFKIHDETQLRRIGISTDFHEALKAEKIRKVSKSKEPKPVSTATNKFQQLKEIHNQGSTMTNNMFRFATSGACQPHTVNSIRGKAIVLSKTVTSRKPFLNVSSQIKSNAQLIANQRVHKSVGRLNSLRMQQQTNTELKATTKTPLARPLQHQKRKELAASLAEENFDGSVPIPKPNSFLFNRPVLNVNVAVSHLSSSASATKCNDKTAEILEAQRIIATELRDSRSCGGNTFKTLTAACKTATVRPESKNRILTENNGLRPRSQELKNKVSNACQKEKSKQKQPSPQMLFGIESEAIDAASILTAKSLFSDDVSAHLYAKSRQCVLELEQKEEFLLKKNQASTGPARKKILTEYACETCNSVRLEKPVSCIMAGHVVKKRRKLEEDKISQSETSNLKKLLLTKQRTSDNDLKLGQGLEWSGWFNK
jgi:hypothetical protein